VTTNIPPSIYIKLHHTDERISHRLAPTVANAHGQRTTRPRRPQIQRPEARPPAQPRSQHQADKQGHRPPRTTPSPMATDVRRARPDRHAARRTHPRGRGAHHDNAQPNNATTTGERSKSSATSGRDSAGLARKPHEGRQGNHRHRTAAAGEW
jgi:hypothetical protein